MIIASSCSVVANTSPNCNMHYTILILWKRIHDKAKTKGPSSTMNRVEKFQSNQSKLKYIIASIAWYKWITYWTLASTYRTNKGWVAPSYITSSNISSRWTCCHIQLNKKHQWKTLRKIVLFKDEMQRFFLMFLKTMHTFFGFQRR